MGQNQIAIITDAWEPQVNGVVRTYQNTIKELRQLGWHVGIIHPHLGMFKRIPLFCYKEIELVLNPWAVKAYLDKEIRRGTRIHIASEGPLGIFSRLYLAHKNYPFTTCFHTLFPEFIHERFKWIPTGLLYPFFRWFHGRAKTVFVPTKMMVKHLEDKRFKNVMLWGRGVDGEIFKPYPTITEKPYIVCVSRISHEKNLDAFCQLQGWQKVLIGDGPYLIELQRKYPDVECLGKMEGAELASWIAGADVFVFPSKADTFGIVILEAIACGTPVAAYKEPGPLEVIIPGINGHYSDDLAHAVSLCRSVFRSDVVGSSKQWTWTRATTQFLEGL